MIKSEGNAIWANGQFQILARVLPNSRLQRHLSDSTIARKIGGAFAYLLISLENATGDTRDFVLREDAMQEDLKDRWGIITSGVQTRLRVLGVKNPYEQLDALAKAGPITHERLDEFIRETPIDEDEKVIFRQWTPENYVGKASELTDQMLEEIDQLGSDKHNKARNYITTS